MAAAHGVCPLSQIASAAASVTTLETNWEFIDAEFRSILAPTALKLSMDELNPAEAGDLFSTLLRTHLEHYNIIQSSDTSNTSMIRRTRRIEKVAEELRLQKNPSRRLLKSSPWQFHNLARAYARAKKAVDQMKRNSSLRKNEKEFRKNPWHFAKSVCKECEGGESRALMHVSSDEAFSYFSSSFEAVSQEYEVSRSTVVLLT